MAAITDLLNTNWGPYTHTEVEEAIKEKFREIDRALENASSEGGIGYDELSKAVRDLLDLASTALQPSSIANWAKSPNKPDYTVGEIIYDGLTTLSQKLAAMDTAIQQAAASGAVEPDSAMSDSSENAVQNKIVKAYIDAVSLRLDTLIGSNNVQGVIDTFNEVKAFLDGINTSDPTLYNTLQTLNTSITNLQTELDTKANAADVYDKEHSYNKTEVDSAIDNAFSEAQVAVVEEGTFGIIDGLGSDSTTDALSAAQGKALKAAILTLWGALGAYAFPDGRPNLSLGGGSVEFSVTYPTDDEKITATPESGTLPESVELLDPLEITLGIASGYNLYVLDDDSVHVYMGGTEVVGAYNPSTGKVTIANVVGNVVIVANAITYVDVDGSDNKLAFMLDCKNGVTRENDTPTKWTDLIGSKEFALTNVGITDAGAVFNGSSSKGVVESGGLDVAWNSATIEFVCSRASASEASPVLINNLNARVLAYFWTAGTNPTAICSFGVNSGNGSTITSPINAAIPISDLNVALSASKVRVVKDGVTLSNPYATDYMDFSAAPRQKLSVGYGLNSNNSEMFLNGTIKAIRVYKTQLTEAQQKQNYKIDKKRFNLS